MSDWVFSGGKRDNGERDLYLEWTRVARDSSRYGAWETVDRTTTRTPLADHPAVLTYRSTGVATDDLTSFIESFASLRAGRVRGVGATQYAHATGQKFEQFSFEDTVRELLEELADASNYLDFLAIRLLSLVKITKESGIDCD